MISMRFLIDERLGSRFAKVLSTHGHTILFAGDIMRGVPDENVLDLLDISEGKFTVVREGQVRVRKL